MEMLTALCKMVNLPLWQIPVETFCMFCIPITDTTFYNEMQELSPDCY